MIKTKGFKMKILLKFYVSYTLVIDISNAKLKSFCKNYVNRLILSNRFIKQLNQITKDHFIVHNLKIRGTSYDDSYVLYSENISTKISLILSSRYSKIKDASRMDASMIDACTTHNIYLKCIDAIVKK